MFVVNESFYSNDKWINVSKLEYFEHFSMKIKMFQIQTITTVLRTALRTFSICIQWSDIKHDTFDFNTRFSSLPAYLQLHSSNCFILTAPLIRYNGSRRSASSIEYHKLICSLIIERITHS